jgi:hypothetical protein
MAKKDLQGRKISEIVEMSRYWDAEDLLRNLDEEMSNLEQGMSHLIWDYEEHRITTWVRPLPVTPRFQLSETDSELRLKVQLPEVVRENIRLNIGTNGVQLFACSNDLVCRPHFLEVESREALDRDSAETNMVGDTLEIKVAKLKKDRSKAKKA